MRCNAYIGKPGEKGMCVRLAARRQFDSDLIRPCFCDGDMDICEFKLFGSRKKKGTVAVTDEMLRRAEK